MCSSTSVSVTAANGRPVRASARALTLVHRDARAPRRGRRRRRVQLDALDVPAGLPREMEEPARMRADVEQPAPARRHAPRQLAQDAAER